jgi:NAD(P)-dependent dehydrogenase (short-subunit alcohol dehydrogenase family)
MRSKVGRDKAIDGNLGKGGIMSFSGKHALIVGGSSGMGLQAGRLLLKAGASVTLVGSRGDKLDRALQTLGAADKAHAFQCDLRRDADAERLIRHVAENMKDVKCLVNAAGVFSLKPFLDHTGEDYDAYMRLNRATFFVTQQVAKNMVASGGGAIVNVGSMWARQAIKATPSSAYSMAKAGLHAFTQHLAMELADHGIRVNAVAPAVVETTIYEAFIAPEKVHETLQGFNAFHPIGRIGTAQDVAAAIVFLLLKSRLLALYPGRGWIYVEKFYT